MDCDDLDNTDDTIVDLDTATGAISVSDDEVPGILPSSWTGCNDVVAEYTDVSYDLD